MKYRKSSILCTVFAVVFSASADDLVDIEPGSFQTGPRNVRRLSNDAFRNAIPAVEMKMLNLYEKPSAPSTAHAHAHVPFAADNDSPTTPTQVSATPTTRVSPPTQVFETSPISTPPPPAPLTEVPRLWPNRTVVYKINETGFSKYQLTQVRKALRSLETRTGCIRTRPVGAQDSDFVEIVYGNQSRFRCKTAWGYKTGRQEFKVHNDCFSHGLRWVLAELLRLLGFPYEHQRADRDKFIEINFGNIVEEGVQYFQKLDPAHHRHFNLPYNFDSLLHYNTYGSGWAKNGSLPVLTTLDRRQQDRIGRSKDLSSGDIRKIRVVYGCDPPPPEGD